MNNLTQRILTGIIGGTVIIGCVLWNAWSFSVLFLVIALLTHREYLTITNSVYPRSITVIFLNTLAGISLYLIFALAAFGFIPMNRLLLIIPVVSAFFIIQLFTHPLQGFRQVGLDITGLIYVILPFCYLVLMAISGRIFFEPGTVLGMLLMIWSNDSFAYFTGRAIGKHKLSGRISPKKTWEGFFGGLLAAVLCAFIFSRYNHSLTPSQWIGMAVITVVFGTLGDLVESMLKRSLDLKDSGSILPGHGGLLDRFDALLLAAPFVFVYLSLIR